MDKSTVLKLEREEQKMMKMAIKNSLVDKGNVTDGLDQIDAMPVYYPTEAEF